MSYYLEAKKSLGQNFLKNKTIINRIAEAGNISDDEIIVEIGPGTGELTEGLLEQIKNTKNARLITIEKDERAIPILAERFKEEIKKKRLEILEGDFLEMELDTILPSKKCEYKIIANIPYYITGAIIRKSLEAKHKPKTLILLVQKEVAERITVRDGKESILSQSVSAFGDAKILMNVSKGNFVPAPNVDSAVLMVENISNNRFTKAKIKEKDFFDMIHAGFAHKRKKLSSNLKKVFPDHNSIKHIEKIFEKLNLDSNIRAEDLSSEQWMNLVHNIQHF